jgi:hypothetical protein
MPKINWLIIEGWRRAPTHLARIEQIIDVLHERLVLDLGVGEEEDGGGVGGAGLASDALEVIAPVGLRVALADFDLQHGQGAKNMTM